MVGKHAGSFHEGSFKNWLLRIALQSGINMLPIEQRLTVVLSDVQGLRYDEIAEITLSKNGTVKSRLSRATANLRE